MTTKHRCAEFTRLYDGFRRDVDGLAESVRLTAHASRRATARTLLAGARARGARVLAAHLAACPECTP